MSTNIYKDGVEYCLSIEIPTVRKLDEVIYKMVKRITEIRSYNPSGFRLKNGKSVYDCWPTECASISKNR
jgi:hypothetical protein